MGQKVHPLGFRLGVSQNHISHWFIDNNHYSQLVVEDQFIRNFFYKKFPGIASINIKRDLNRIVIEILSANTRDLLMNGGKMTAKATLSSGANPELSNAPGQSVEQSPVRSDQVKSPQNVSNSSVDNVCDQLLKELTAYRKTILQKRFKSYRIDKKAITATSSSSTRDNTNRTLPQISPGESQGNPPTDLSIFQKIMEVELFWTKVENPNTSAACLAEFIVEQLEKRVPFRRVLKRSIQKAEEASVEGIKVQISGRLNGAEIARSERIHKGQVPLHTLRAKIEYNSRTAKTIYGLLGVKVWVFNGFADVNQAKLLT